MEILVVILVVALIAVIAFAVAQRRSAGLTGRPGSPLPRRSRAAASRDPMAAAVADHAEATDPQDAALAEQRLRAQARQVAAGMGAGSEAAAGHDPAGATGYAVPASTLAPADQPIDQRTSGAELPAAYDDHSQDGRRSGDWVAPQDEDERLGR